MKENEILILWTTADKDTATKMVLMYSLNSKINGWWKEITLLVWGSSAKLVAQDKEIQQELEEMIVIGIKVMACKECSDRLSVTTELEKIGIDVKHTGKFLTDWLKSGKNILTV